MTSVSGFIDFHCHLSSDTLLPQAQSLIQHSFEQGVAVLNLAGTHPDEWRNQITLLHQYPETIRCNLGLHPWWVESFSEHEIKNALEELESMLPEVSGLGETGLDFGKKRDPNQFEKQVFAFRDQIDLALKLQKPLVLHVVSAHEEALKVLKEHSAFDVPVVLHRFSGNAEQAQAYLDQGAFLSFHTAILGRTSGKTIEAVKATPLNRLFFESDLSDAVTDPKTQATDVIGLYQQVAQMRGIELQALKQIVAENLANFY